MPDQEDAPPTRTGQAVTPTRYVMFGEAPDGTFVLSFEPDDDEMAIRALAHKGAFALDRYFTNKAFQKEMEKAKERRVIEGMVTPVDPTSRRLRVQRG